MFNKEKVVRSQEEVKQFFKSIINSGIRVRQRRVDKFDKSTMKTIILSLEGGVLAVTGGFKNSPDVRKIQTLIFNKSKNAYGIKHWYLKDAKNWVKSYKNGIKGITDPEKMINKVLVTRMIKSMEKTLIKSLPKIIEKALGGEE